MPVPVPVPVPVLIHFWIFFSLLSKNVACWIKTEGIPEEGEGCEEKTQKNANSRLGEKDDGENDGHPREEDRTYMRICV